MDIFYIVYIAVLMIAVLFLILRQNSYIKRINAMKSVIEENLDSQKKQQIFSEKEDELSSLAFQINRLTDLYETAQKKYEREQIGKKQLIANLSHDVRTPLVSVIGYLEAIVQGRIGEGQKDDYVHTAYEKAIVLKEKMNQLFEFVQSDANEIKLFMEKLDVCELTRQVLIDFLPIVESENIEMESSIPDDEFNVRVDKEGFVRIVQNLVKNTLVHGSERKYLGVFIKKEESNIYIDIADKGQGIDKEHLPFVFERLYKADSSRTRGGGIGLAIAKELANKMGGNIEILRSIPGDTVFRITFTEAK